MTSSTSNSDPARLPIAACIAIVLLAGLELSLHFNAEKWFPRAVTGDFRSDSIDACIRLAEQSPDLRVAVVGSSISRAVNAAALSRRLGNEKPADSANFVMFSANPEGVGRLLEAVVFPHQNPDFLVLPVSSRDVNDTGSLAAINRHIPDLESYARSPWKHRSQRLVHRHFYLWRYRGVVTNRALSWVRPRNYDEFTPQTANAGPSIEHQRFSEQSDSRAALAQSLEQARSRGVTPVLVTLPVNPDRATADYRAEETRWMASFADFARINDYLLLPGDRLELTPEDYRDAHHLNPRGVEKVTRRLADALKSAEKS